MTPNLNHAGLLAMLFAALAGAPAIGAEPYDEAPIFYTQTQPQNPVSRLIGEVEAGRVQLSHQEGLGYLPALLAALKVPSSSQTLVYSKTSLQRQHITPATPRALYFNDEVYVGFCQYGEVLEISAADEKLGAVFYTLNQDEEQPRFTRQGDNCLLCHGSSQTRNVPGHLLRSVFVHPSGLPILSAATRRINQTSPIEERWGGWYVTGTHGTQEHLGNLVIESREVPNVVDNRAGLNVPQLKSRFDTSAYLTGHSDLVALLVLEHQAEAHNLIAQMNYETRQALHYQVSLNRELGKPADHVWDSVKSRIRSAGERLVQYLLFSEEAPLKARMSGTSGFAEEFSRLGPRDQQGRSLRDFDLEQRVFRYPCSYLIYSPSFQSLPAEAHEYLYERLRQILQGEDQSKPYSHLTPADRLAILEILRDTIPGLPELWRDGPAAVDRR